MDELWKNQIVTAVMIVISTSPLASIVFMNSFSK